MSSYLPSRSLQVACRKDPVVPCPQMIGVQLRLIDRPGRGIGAALRNFAAVLRRIPRSRPSSTWFVVLAIAGSCRRHPSLPIHCLHAWRCANDGREAGVSRAFYIADEYVDNQVGRIRNDFDVLSDSTLEL